MACKVISIIDIQGSSKIDNFSVNLSKTFSDSERVLLLDLDPQAKSSKYLKISQKFSILNILNREKDFHDVVQKTEFKNIFVLPSNIDVVKIEKNKVLISRFAEVMNYLKTKFDYIIIETPPYQNSLTLHFIDSSNKVLIPLKVENMITYFGDQILEVLKNSDSKIKIIPIIYEDQNIDIYSTIIKKYSKYLFKLGSASLKIDKDDNFENKFRKIKEVIFND